MIESEEREEKMMRTVVIGKKQVLEEVPEKEQELEAWVPYSIYVNGNCRGWNNGAYYRRYNGTLKCHQWEFGDDFRWFGKSMDKTIIRREKDQ